MKHVVCLGVVRNSCRILVAKAEENYHVENVGLDRSITLIRI
jgi:hypothetical protein